jgi:hypothetical protein
MVPLLSVSFMATTRHPLGAVVPSVTAAPPLIGKVEKTAFSLVAEVLQPPPVATWPAAQFASSLFPFLIFAGVFV